MIFPLSPSTASEKLRIISISTATAVALSAGEELLIVGAVVSMIKAWLAAKEPEAPGDASVRVASFPALSLMVPPFNWRAEVEV